MKNFLNITNRFSIRKFSIGAASIVVGSLLFSGINHEAHASENTSNENINQEKTVHTENSDLSNNNIEATKSDSSQSNQVNSENTNFQQSNKDNVETVESNDSKDNMNTAQSVDNKDNVKPVQPDDNKDNVKPVQPDDNKDNVKPVQPDDNKDNVKPAQPDDNKDNVKPAQPDDNKDNVKPAQPDDNKDNVKPTQPDDNKDNVKPTQSDDSKDNVKPTQSDDSKDNVKPTQSDDSKDNVKPTQSDDSKDNVKPTQSKVNSSNAKALSNDSILTKDTDLKENKDAVNKYFKKNEVDDDVAKYINDNWDRMDSKEIQSILLKDLMNKNDKYKAFATPRENTTRNRMVNLESKAKSEKTKNYVIKNGEYLGGIAQKFKTTSAHLQKINNIKNPDYIQAGQTIKVPDNSATKPSKPSKPTNPTKPSDNNSKTLVTKDQMKKFGWNTNGLKDSVIKDLNNALNKFNINTPKRIQHFMAQVAQESMKGLYPTEIADGSAYEGRTDLGNTKPGDGKKFKGGGYIQLTGRSNYTAFSKAMKDPDIVNKGVEYVANKYPWSSAAWFWNNKNINKIVDNGGSVQDVTRVVNGGTNGLNDRINYYNQAKKIFT
ncbi:YSIRK-type signal peptide-containing protein [Staphylococcus warneri]|uniref:LysM peptidoglycan-binding domain-containing protein n=1 Tax=Staphylococcus warneri TaxID=1292 RepID=UPI001E548B41|nr:LysM peptidoglycan-binding domain-containing protein [Staphylococcus warneri]MCD8804638.1 YSIRK-type signal peptide-containing protein [Staphylococcus warneri]